jgi:hypothetical protein
MASRQKQHQSIYLYLFISKSIYLFKKLKNPTKKEEELEEDLGGAGAHAPVADGNGIDFR